MSEHERFMLELIPQSKVPMPQALPIEDALYQHFQMEFGLYDISLVRLRKICAAEREGRVVILAEHAIKNGATVWALEDGKIVEGTVTHHKNPYRMYFLSSDQRLGFPVFNSMIGEEVFLSIEDAAAAGKAEITDF